MQDGAHHPVLWRLRFIIWGRYLIIRLWGIQSLEGMEGYSLDSPGYKAQAQAKDQAEYQDPVPDVWVACSGDHGVSFQKGRDISMLGRIRGTRALRIHLERGKDRMSRATAPTEVRMRMIPRLASIPPPIR